MDDLYSGPLQPLDHLPAEVMAAVHRRLREWSLAEMQRTGNYDLASCEWCRCSKSGSEDIPNRHTEACEAPTCSCHDDPDNYLAELHERARHDWEEDQREVTTP
jgi:hypothetical protein